MRTIHVRVSTPGFARPPTDFRFDRDELRIGSAADNDLVLPHGSVRPHHARLQATPGGDYFFLRDEVTGFVDIADGESVPLGQYELRLSRRAPPEPQEAAFIQKLAANPSDDETRLVLADWLEEKGRIDEAKFVRLQLELPIIPQDTPAFREARIKLHNLSEDLPLDWRRTVARPAIENCDFRFEFQCPKQWGALEPTADPAKRFCHSCKKNVHYAPTVDDARRLAIAGECVAVDVRQPRRDNDLKERERHLMAGMIAPPSRY